MDSGERVQSSLPPRARRTGPTPEHQRNRPLDASLWATVSIFENPRRLRTVTEVTLERPGGPHLSRGLTERCWQPVSAPTRLLTCLQQGILERVKGRFFCQPPLHRGPVGPCRAGMKDQAAQFVFSLLCAHRLFQNNSSAKRSDAHEGCGQVMTRFLLGHRLSPTYCLFFWSQCPYTEGS